MPQPVYPATHLGEFLFDRIKLLPLLLRYSVHLLIDEPHQSSDVPLGENVLPQLVDDQALEALRVEPWRLAGAPSSFQEGSRCTCRPWPRGR